MTDCPDCKGSGKYIGLNEVTECKTCCRIVYVDLRSIKINGQIFEGPIRDPKATP